MSNEKPNILSQLLEEIEDLKKAKELLEKVYSEHGPYRDEKISDKTWYQVQDYFHFDDSE